MSLMLPLRVIYLQQLAFGRCSGWRYSSNLAERQRFTRLRSLFEQRSTSQNHVSTCLQFSQSTNQSGDSDDVKKFDGVIPLEKVELKYVASGGPGGQHVNKTNSKAELRFHVASATWLADKARLVFTEQQRHRINKDGYYIVISERTRSQLQNQADVLDRLREAVSAAYRTAFEPARDPEEVQAEEQMKLRRFNRAARYRLREKRMASADKRWRQYDSKDW